jgi:RNA polymerase sigma-70 factor (ECF subfamily)
MMPTMSKQEETPGRAAGSQFAATRWTLVLAAGCRPSPKAADAMSELCRIYWYPLYAYVRRRGYGAQDAEDLTQEFFARILAKDYLASVDRSKGKFRSFLLASLKHFLANEWDRAHAQKRGGGQPTIPLDGFSAKTRYNREPAHDVTPEKLFERQWAITVLEQVMGRLKRDFVSSEKVKIFDLLKPFLAGDRTSTTYAQVGEALGMTEGAVKVAIHRMRRRYRELLREEIAQTVAGREEVADEIRCLLRCL